MYIPKDSMDVSTLPISPRRYGIIGKPGTGKTWAALTFPNPVVLDTDNNLAGFRDAHPEAKFSVVPVWNRDFVEKTLKIVNNTKDRRIDPSLPHNIRDAFNKWIETEAPLLEPDQTLIVDSFTSLNDGHDRQAQLPFEKEYSVKTGKEDGFAFWGKKLAFNTNALTAIRSTRCLVVCIFHEAPEYDDNGIQVGIKPLIQGQSGDKAPKDFSDFFRQIVVTKDKPVPGLEFKEGEKVIYAWQTCKDRYFQIAKKSSVNLPDFVRADFKSLV